MEVVDYTILLNLIISITILYFIFTMSEKIELLISSDKTMSSALGGDIKIKKTKIELLNDEKYYYYVLNALSSAKKEINIIMFSIYKCKKTEDLIYALINARKKGVCPM